MYIDHANREDTEGLYTCEVTTFPSFARTSESKRLTVVGESASPIFFCSNDCTDVEPIANHRMPVPMFMQSFLHLLIHTAHSADAQELKNDGERTRNSAFARSCQATWITLSALANTIILSLALVYI